MIFRKATISDLDAISHLYGFIAEYHVHRNGCTAWAWVNAKQAYWFLIYSFAIVREFSLTVATK